MRRTPILTVIALAALALTSCSSGSTDPAPELSGVSPSTRPPLQTTTPGPIGPSGPAIAVPQSRWDALVADLTKRGVTGTPQLVSSEAVTFNDGSLGCPSPGQSYTQAQIDGMRVVVSVDSKTYDYRFGQGAEPKLCGA
ncbi:hypothetical protein HMPREF1529_00423 [Microbacterium sp. oral taxon 186 str. F0373]|uniref:hypothetical protein n=1 Tax=Microbacterium sp. oral taxon 186 TaxID=712383 RepID=UPI00034E65E6|nr:hypothetical protein [Microbacterium sp. oral taxon 186]EPD86371.1 hypothetical protein HMPREF1529_00423 [Microbacterium sp. oral taxon 186 str. F0373]